MSLSLLKVEMAGAFVTESLEAPIKRKELLDKLSVVQTVTNADEQEAAVTLCRQVKDELTQVENHRKTLKEPVNKLGREIDRIAASFCDPLELELKRIGAKVGEFQVAEKRRVAEAERQQAEAARIAFQKAEEARLEAERAAAHAKQLAAAQETAQSAPETPAGELALTVPAPNAQESEDANMAALIAKDRADEMLAQAEEEIRMPAPTVFRPSGIVMKNKLTFEITDKAKVYEKYPHFFDLKEKKAVINAVIHKDFVCEGMTVSEELDTNFRR